MFLLNLVETLLVENLLGGSFLIIFKVFRPEKATTMSEKDNLRMESEQLRYTVQVFCFKFFV